MMAGSPDIVFLHPKYSDTPDSLKKTLFDPQRLEQANLITRKLRGRGTTYFYQLRDQACVLRHYWRGGFMRNLSDDAYIWLGLARSRSYREWKLLKTLEKLNLPAPRRVGLRIQRAGILYRSDIVTEEIENADSLPAILRERDLTQEEWQRIGSTIGQFHKHGIFHQDLNANNILMGLDSCSLIDFDRGRIMRGDWWKERMLNRLKHSLEKISGLEDTFHFDPSHWMSLLDGYEEPS